MDSYAKGFAAGQKHKPSQVGNYSEGNKVLTNSELGGNLTLIYDYNLKKRNIEADFSERLQRLDADYRGKSGKMAGDELEKLVQAKLRTNQNMTYSEAFGAVQIENPKLVNEYIQEIR
jgi:hypothetical protein